MKLWQKIFTASAIGCTIFINLPTVDAKIVTDRVPLLTYADSSVPVYDAPNGKKTGTIKAGSSLVLITKIQSDGWAYGSYQIVGKKRRVYRWFNMNELQGYSDFENYTDKVTGDTNAYRTRTSMNLIGKIPSEEDFIVVANRGDKIKVIFKGDGNKYRMGWVDKTMMNENSVTQDSENDLPVTYTEDDESPVDEDEHSLVYED